MDTSIEYVLVNNSNMDIAFLLPYDDHVLEVTNQKEIDRNDTTLIGSALKLDEFCVPAHQTRPQMYSGFETWDEICPNDTLRIFVIRHIVFQRYAGFEQDKYGTDKYFLHRYDLSINELKSLSEGRKLKLSYPPDKRMKNMKMWPRYETLVE